MFDVAVIGAGIVGLAHAWQAARRRRSVVLIERTGAAQGASVRNFGMIWPIGQPRGELHAVALRSREYWRELGRAGVVDVRECGSIHLAHAADEMQVLEEFRDLQVQPVTLLSPAEVRERAVLANPERLVGGMWSDTELRVNPRVASAQMGRWLAERFGVECCFHTQVVAVEGKTVTASDGRSWQAERIIISSGSDLQTLFPQVLGNSGLKLCKLQMLKSVAQKNLSPQHPHLASGLTLRHYQSFQECPSLSSVQERFARESPELDRYGIHVMASPFPGGEVILGDSHEYDADITPFDKSEIDELMLRELKKVFWLGDWSIAERWHGIYAKHPQLPIVETECQPSVQVAVGPGGAGMTMSFGLAERAWNRWEGPAS